MLRRLGDEEGLVAVASIRVRRLRLVEHGKGIDSEMVATG